MLWLFVGLLFGLFVLFMFVVGALFLLTFWCVFISLLCFGICGDCLFFCAVLGCLVLYLFASGVCLRLLAVA